MHPEIVERVERLNNDFERVQGYRFSHFFCPILLVDEEASLCRGHIIPQSTDGPGSWIPQREDVDNTLGAKLEEHLSRLDLRQSKAQDLLLNKTYVGFSRHGLKSVESRYVITRREAFNQLKGTRHLSLKKPTEFTTSI